MLDPAQNHSFRDHYLEINVDLSRVLFIATSNQLGTIHPALLDRMEIISLAGYSEEEKLHIARRYLIPRQLDENGLTPAQVTFDDDAIRRIISGLHARSRRAQPRAPDRRGRAARSRRASPRQRGRDAGRRRSIDPRRTMCRDYLGPPRFHHEVSFRVSRPGVATGVAWTEVGRRRAVRRSEPAAVGPSRPDPHRPARQRHAGIGARRGQPHPRRRAAKLGVSAEFLDTNDLHVHVPAGAIPKDGPSAGVTMATAIVSALRNQPVREDVAMTGEITLSGLVLPVGGIREKALAARRHGIKTFILPALNEAGSRRTAARSAKRHAVRAGIDPRRCAQGRPACRRYPLCRTNSPSCVPRLDCYRGFVRPRRCARRPVAGAAAPSTGHVKLTSRVRGTPLPSNVYQPRAVSELTTPSLIPEIKNVVIYLKGVTFDGVLPVSHQEIRQEHEAFVPRVAGRHPRIDGRLPERRSVLSQRLLAVERGDVRPRAATRWADQQVGHVRRSRAWSRSTATSTRT